MTVVPVAEQMTADEFLELPLSEHNRPWSLIDGEVVVSEPTALHGEVLMELLFALESWTRAGAGRGKAALPRDVKLDDRNVYAPDLLWYAEGRAPDRHDPRPYPMPDIAAEVRSPSTWRYDIGAKKAGYERHALPELWLLDTAAEAVLVYRRSTSRAAGFDVALELAGAERLMSPLLPGFGPAVESLFAQRP